MKKHLRVKAKVKEKDRKLLKVNKRSELKIKLIY
jgi:hypothetical protein